VAVGRAFERLRAAAWAEDLAVTEHVLTPPGSSGRAGARMLFRGAP
jgi:hypothetical protein